MKLGRNLFAKLNLGPDRPIHDLYSFILGAYIMIIMSSMLNSILQKYHVVKDDQGKIYWRAVKDYLFQKAWKVTIILRLVIICAVIIY